MAVGRANESVGDGCRCGTNFLWKLLPTALTRRAGSCCCLRNQHRCRASFAGKREVRYRLTLPALFISGRATDAVGLPSGRRRRSTVCTLARPGIMYASMKSGISFAGTEERAEAAACPIRFRDPIPFKEPGKKFLGQVLGVMGRASAPPGIGIERIPIRFTQSGQCVIRAGITQTSRENH